MQDSKIGTREAISLILTIAVAHTIVSTPSKLLTDMKSAVLVNTIYVCFIVILISYFIIKLFKNFPGLDILDISEFLGGKIFKNIFGFIFIIYFVLSSSFLLKEFAEALRIIYYPMTNVGFIILLFMIACAITTRLEFGATIKANLILTPIIIFSSIFLFASNITSFSIAKVFPILGNGIFNTFIIGIGNITSFAGISFIYFLPPLLKKPEDFKKITINSIIIFFIFLLINVSVILFMFSYLMSENEMLPLFTASQYIQIGDFFVRFEVIFLLIWMEVFACYISIVIKFCMLILKKICLVENSKVFSLPLCLLILGIGIIPISYSKIGEFNNKVYPYISLIFNYIFCILLLIFANLKNNKYKEVGGNINDTSK